MKRIQRLIIDNGFKKVRSTVYEEDLIDLESRLALFQKENENLINLICSACQYGRGETEIVQILEKGCVLVTGKFLPNWVDSTPEIDLLIKKIQGENEG